MKFEHCIFWFLVGMLVGMILGVNCNEADAAEWEIVSFNDAEHLAALQDSVIGVCDTVEGTVWGQIFLEQANYSIDGTRLNIVRPGVVYYDGLSGMEGAYQYLITTKTITCRELVSITVMCYPWKDERKAIIFYRSYRPVGEVKR